MEIWFAETALAFSTTAQLTQTQARSSSWSCYPCHVSWLNQLPQFSLLFVFFSPFSLLLNDHRFEFLFLRTDCVFSTSVSVSGEITNWSRVSVSLQFRVDSVKEDSVRMFSDRTEKIGEFRKKEDVTFRSPVYGDRYEVENGTGAAGDVHRDVEVADKARQTPGSVHLENEQTNCED